MRPRSVPHSQWQQIPAAKQQQQQQQHQHRVWARLRGPFVLPSWALHEHEWERYDANAAGCLLCGAQHLCDGGSACTQGAIECEDGARVCPITAYSIPCIRAARSEFSDCQALHHQHQQQQQQRAGDTTQDRTRECVQTMVRQVLAGEPTRLALTAERDAMLARRALELTRICRAHKLVVGLPNLVDIAAELAATTGAARDPLLLSEAALTQLVESCTDSVACFLCALGMLLETVGHAKMFALVLGLLYMMRHGVNRNGAEMLPRVAALQRALPLENAMPATFGVRPKIITETENAVKMAMRQLSHRELTQYCRLRALPR